MKGGSEGKKCRDGKKRLEKGSREGKERRKNGRELDEGKVGEEGKERS